MSDRCPVTRRFGEGKHGRCGRAVIYEHRCVDHVTREQLAEAWLRYLELRGRKGGRAALREAEKLTRAIVTQEDCHADQT